MRVAVLLEQLLQPVPGGTGRYARELTTALAARAGEDTLQGWTARHADTAAATIPGLPPPRTLPLPREVLNRLWSSPLIPGLPLLGPRGADVVFAPTPFAPSGRGGSPLVVAVHDAVPWTAPDSMTPRSLGWHRRVLAGFARSAAAVVVPTRATAEALSTYLPDLRGDRVHVTGEGISAATTVVPADAAARATALGLPERYLLMVATLEPRKGIDVALRALADPRLGSLPLLLIGPQGWGGVDPLLQASTYGLAADRVRLLGRVPDADLAVAYARATALLVPSRDEGFGLPAVEALAHGTPVVISSAPALVEVAGEAGIVTPVGDRRAVADAVADILGWTPAQRADYAALARRQAARHTWEQAATRTWEVLRAVAADRRA